MATFHLLTVWSCRQPVPRETRWVKRARSLVISAHSLLSQTMAGVAGNFEVLRLRLESARRSAGSQQNRTC